MISQVINPDLKSRRQRYRQQLGIDSERDPKLVYAFDVASDTLDDERPVPRSLDVAMTLRHLGVDRSTLTATLLSDPRLRESLKEQQIAQAFGRDIAELVSSAHWLNTFKECEYEKVQTAEQSERLRRMLLAMVKDIRAMLINLAYRVQRLRGLPRENYDTRRCIARETLDVYAPLANRLGVAQLKWELEDLAFRYLEPQAYKRIANGLEETRAARETYIQDFVNTLSNALKCEHVVGQIKGRPKHIYSIWRKMQQKDRSFAELYDLRAVRVIVDKVSQCYAALGVVHSLWQHIPKEFDDYIANPKDNGYRSLHTAVLGPQGKIVEVQIRTGEMHEFAEKGVAAHWVYKEGRDQDEVMQRSIDSLRQLLETGEGDSELISSFRSELFQDRVFVLTPSGDIMDLPRGATPLDFAYSIHTEVGNRCRGAKINGRIVPLTYQLNSGEQVEILTAKQGQPSRDWLNSHLGYLRTSRARSKVRHWFKQLDRERNVQDGRVILERELQRLGVKDANLEQLAEHFTHDGVDNLMASIGRGEISSVQIANALQVPGFHEAKLPAGDSQRLRKTRHPPEEISIQGVGNLLTQLGRCCKPMPGDPVIGYITQGKGVTVHRRDCRNILNLSDNLQDRLIEVDWGGKGPVYPVDVHVDAFDRQGLLRDITAVLSNERVNLLRANTWTNKRDQSVTMELTLEITNAAQLSRLLDMILQVPNVLEARRHTG